MGHCKFVVGDCVGYDYLMERSKGVKGILWATFVVLLSLWVYPASVYWGWYRESKVIKSLEAFKDVHTRTDTADL